MKQNRYPAGWDEERVQRVIDYYENQTEDEAVAEAESAFRDELVTRIEIPSELVSVVRELVLKHKVHDRQQYNKMFHFTTARFVLGLPHSTQWASMGYLAPEIEATEHRIKIHSI